MSLDAFGRLLLCADAIALLALAIVVWREGRRAGGTQRMIAAAVAALLAAAALVIGQAVVT